MGQLEIVKKSEHGRSYRIRGQTKSSMQLPLVGISIVVVAAVAVPLIIVSIYINLPWLQVFWLEVMPNLWRLGCGIFTPRNLFIVLNILILSILTLAHLQSRSTSSVLRRPSSSQSVANNQSDRHRRRQIGTDHDDHQSGSMKLNEDDDTDGELNSSADEFSSEIDLNNVEQRIGRAILSDQPIKHVEIESVGNAHCNADEHSVATAISTNHGLNHLINEEYNEGGEASILNGSAHRAIAELQFIKASMQQWRCSSDAEEEGAATESEKAKKAISGAADFDGTVNIDSLLAEKASILAQLESPRPLASAHFTRKRATPPNDRPLSPLRTILKRGDTLEATWKAICERKRQSSPFNRHHEAHSHHHGHSRGKPRASSPSLLSPIKQRHKATINNMLHHDDELPRSRLPRKREPSIPQEELNAKVESFISRFNAQIKMQREKSILDYMEMVGRGAS